jgi:hypothetical protein
VRREKRLPRHGESARLFSASRDDKQGESPVALLTFQISDKKSATPDGVALKTVRK